MLEITVKTLNGQNHTFVVEDNITVKEFKVVIAERINIPAETQRLIFQGRILSDEKPIQEYDVSGKTLHVVEKPPPVPGREERSGGAAATSSQPDRQRGTRGRGRGGFNIQFDPTNANNIQQAVQDSLNRMGGAAQRAQVTTNASADGSHVNVQINLGNVPAGPGGIGAAHKQIEVARRMTALGNECLDKLEGRGPFVPRRQPRGSQQPAPTQASEDSDDFSPRLEPVMAAVSAEVRIGRPTSLTHTPGQGFTVEGAANPPFAMPQMEPMEQSAEEHRYAQYVGPPGQIFNLPEGQVPPEVSQLLNLPGTQVTDMVHVVEVEERMGEEQEEPLPAPPEAPPTASTSGAEEGATEGAPAPTRTGPLSPVDLAEVTQEVMNLQLRLQPYLEQHQQMLASDEAYSNEEEQRRRQRLYNMVTETMHALGHAYHALSDVVVDVREATPRPLHAQFIPSTAMTGGMPMGGPVQMSIPVTIAMPVGVAAAPASGAPVNPAAGPQPARPTAATGPQRLARPMALRDAAGQMMRLPGAPRAAAGGMSVSSTDPYVFMHMDPNGVVSLNSVTAHVVQHDGSAPTGPIPGIPGFLGIPTGAFGNPADASAQSVPGNPGASGLQMISGVPGAFLLPASNHGLLPPPPPQAIFHYRPDQPRPSTQQLGPALPPLSERFRLPVHRLAGNGDTMRVGVARTNIPMPRGIGHGQRRPMGAPHMAGHYRLPRAGAPDASTNGNGSHPGGRRVLPSTGLDPLMPCRSYHLGSHRSRQAAQRVRQDPDESTAVDGILNSIVSAVAGATVNLTQGSLNTTSQDSASAAPTTAATQTPVSTNASSATSTTAASTTPSQAPQSTPSGGAQGTSPPSINAFAGLFGGNMNVPLRGQAAPGDVFADVLGQLFQAADNIQHNRPTFTGLGRAGEAVRTSRPTMPTMAGMPHMEGMAGLAGIPRMAGMAGMQFGPMLQSVSQAMFGQSTETLGSFLGTMGILPAPENTEDFFTLLFLEVVTNLTFGDIVQIMMLGSSQPIQRLRPRLHQFVSQRLFNSQRPSAEDIDAAVTRLLDSVSSQLEEFTTGEGVRPDIDYEATVNTFLENNLALLLGRVVNSSNDDVNFGRDIMAELQSLVQQFITLSDHCFVEGAAGLNRFVQAHVDRVFNPEGEDVVMRTWLSGSLQSQLARTRPNITLTLADVQQYVVPRNQAPETEEGTSEQAEEEFMSAEEGEVSESTEVESLGNPAPQIGEDIPLVNTFGVPLDVGSTNSVAGHRPPRSAAAVNGSRFGRLVTEDQPAPIPPLGSEDWHHIVPADWVPVIAQDSQRQKRAEGSRPFSDAYMAGMPHKRRKMDSQGSQDLEDPENVEFSRPDDTIVQAIAQASEAVGARPITSPEAIAQDVHSNVPLQEAFEGEVRDLLRNRLRRDTDFIPNRFPASEKYYGNKKDQH